MRDIRYHSADSVFSLCVCVVCVCVCVCVCVLCGGKRHVKETKTPVQSIAYVSIRQHTSAYVSIRQRTTPVQSMANESLIL